MILQSLTLNHFRNYTSCTVSLSDSVNIFVGENAQGKTNLLESMVFISTTRSHRKCEDIDMVEEGEPVCRVSVKLNEDGISTELSGLISKEGKRLLVQKQPVKKSSEFVGKLNAILFSPSDFELFDGSPKVRRRFMDMEIGKVKPNYVSYLNSYQKILKERNAVLKEDTFDIQYLEVLTDRLCSISLKIQKDRQEFMDYLNRKLSHSYEIISSEPLPLQLKYYSCVEDGDDEIKLKEKYEKFKERDIFLKQTNIGIHKDDFEFLLNQKEINSYASQGQKRMVLLSLKTSLIDYIKHISNRDAVLLLDDVLSELDETRQKNLISLIPDHIQTILTTTNIHEVLLNLPKGARVFEISDGRVISVREV